ncbi:INTS4 [Lepeophtheirus salmonis]|uniref:INTS4 n=1 Tax=Lepeophtheirus salmonis TaxID=72036 RepID=A0A7R8HAZ9_LEPSM|nr:INTS4 [Lepeophtheirus salmonis]CAF2983558.1 INTS4 [Lepeophtheirus salmonis]
MSASVCLYQRSSPDNQNDPEAFSSDYQVWIYKEHRSYSAMECFLGGRRVARKILNVALFLISTQENLKSSSFILPLILMALPLRPSFLAFGYGVSPILRELTDSVSTDSIQTSSCLAFIVHLLTHRYELTQDSSVVFANARLSLCAALFGSVCLASRLQSSYEAFLLLSVAVLIFVLIPLIEVELIQDFVAFLSVISWEWNLQKTFSLRRLMQQFSVPNVGLVQQWTLYYTLTLEDIKPNLIVHILPPDNDQDINENYRMKEKMYPLSSQNSCESDRIIVCPKIRKRLLNGTESESSFKKRKVSNSSTNWVIGDLQALRVNTGDSLNIQRTNGLELLTESTTAYANHKDNYDFTVSNDEMKVFIDYMRRNSSSISSNDISIAESMIPYNGRYPIQQSARAESLRWVYKSWVAASCNGYVYNIDFIQGDNMERDSLNKYKSTYGLSGAMMLEFIDHIEHEYSDRKFELYLDNSFASFKIIEELEKRGHGVTGAIRDSNNCPFTERETFQNYNQGSLEYFLDKNRNILALRWKDGNVITIASNQHGIKPMKKIEQYSVTLKKRITLNVPFMIRRFNSHMDGVHRLEANLSQLGISIRGKTWEFSIICFLLNVCVNNSWIFARQGGYKGDLLEFTRSLVNHWLITYGKFSKKRDYQLIKPIVKKTYKLIPDIRKMAVKLKKRALAEYHHSSTITETECNPEPLKKSKKLWMRLLLRQSEDSARSLLPNPSLLSPRELSMYAVNLSGRLSLLSSEEIRDSLVKLSDLLDSSENEDVRSQICGILVIIIGRTPATLKKWTALLKEKAESSWFSVLKNEKKGSETIPKILHLYATLYKLHPPLISPKVHNLALERLKDPDHDVQAKALILLGHTAGLQGHKEEVVSLIAQYTKSSDPRVRSQAFETLLIIHETLSPLNIEFYKEMEGALKDDFDRVRGNCLKLISAMSRVYPDHVLRNKEELRLADDAFSKICEGFNDVNVHVRELAASLIGNNARVSQLFLEQTLDKKLMSNMRLKKSAHEREAKMVSAGEWSSGRNWADDAPKEELNAETVSLMNFGACGAFIHGLEDEYMAVRSASVDSLTKLSIENSKLAMLALDFLVDMFNDEIEMIETILSALDDFSFVVREKLHIMLQSVCIATKDGLQRVINKLLENLKKYPQDKRSLFVTFKKIGARHAELSLPLVTQLLEVHPFFDTPEPDVEDSSYIYINTKRHYQYLVDTFPNLVPASFDTKGCVKEEYDDGSSSIGTKFLSQVLHRVKISVSRSINERITMADRACVDLERLASIEPPKSSSAEFARLYILSQSLFFKCLKTKFWVNNSVLGIDMIKNNIDTMFKICLQLRHRFRVPKDSVLHKRIGELKLVVMALNLLFIVRASNKSALNASEMFMKEMRRVISSYEDEEGNVKEDEILSTSPFLYNLLCKLNEEKEEHKPGVIARVVQPLLLSDPIESLQEWPTDDKSITMTKAVIFDPPGNNEVALKYTAGMVLAVPVDAELYGVTDEDMPNIRLSIKTPDQKILMVTPRPSEFFKKDDHTYRLLTNALMSHQIWSEAMHVEISLVLDLTGLSEPSSSHSSSSSSHHSTPKRKKAIQDEEKNIIHISDSVKVYVLPKAVKRGI